MSVLDRSVNRYVEYDEELIIQIYMVIKMTAEISLQVCGVCYLRSTDDKIT